MDDYRLIADEVAADITSGRLRPGQQLPTQRAFARRRGIAASTAGRVYRELVRRGLTVGEVGRGTFVRAGGRSGENGRIALAEPATAPIDLELNYPSAPGQAELLAGALTPLLRADALEEALRPVGAAGTDAARQSFAGLLTAGTGGWEVEARGLLFAGNGRQAVAGALAALVAPGQRLGVEALTYPVVKAVAGRLGVRLVPLAVDEHGLRPDAVAAAHRTAPLSAVYLQPRLQNPLGTSLPPERAVALAAELRRLDLPVVEDAIWSFLRPELAPLAALAPERTVLVDSLSKRLAPGLTVGFAVVPDGLRERVAGALRTGGWTPSGFALEAAVRWIADGTLAAVTAAKRTDAAARQALAREALAGQRLRADPCSYYLWWELPGSWRAEAFVAAAARAGISVTPAAAFAVDPRSTPSAVRVGLASPPLPVLAWALRVLAGIADG
ncbi:PLP-dependent aminotransferase family protein [Kitasatospora aureofaciens]|uniref:GntR family transcriptional regulator n=4 Tax=Streptomycetaceae TaxID=2062 RepID=A0A1E7MZP0_KITAU|nr:PLP-dependent aminotransferase family protein [Kitasatospora aureofaciens]ARF77749.1 GntR family transcriptional regulator [Kitasatospora aureofaciens]OEV33906.1 GntR family transcriptional regulator [Kitasatospora aureofaciens]GGU74253.1 GntR family transcriptional regulator [Kitasatospora aureofaciens]